MSAEHSLLPWQLGDWSRLAPALGGNRLAHGLLITGAPGVGKRHFAGVLVRALLCASPGEEGRPCGACRECEQVAAGSHPDLASLAPKEDGGSIGVAEVRGFTHRLFLTSESGHGRVGLIEPAERMTPAAANSLLKALEEPPAGSHLILVTDRTRALLPTIRSRCQTLRLSGAGPAELDQWLAQAPQGTAAMLPLARNAPLRAARLAEAGVPALQEQWFQDISQLAAAKQDPVTVAGGWRDTGGEALLDWLYLVCADVLKASAGAEANRLLFEQHTETITALAGALDTGRLRRLVPEIVRAQRLRETPVDARLDLEALCVGLFACRRRSGRPST